MFLKISWQVSQKISSNMTRVLRLKEEVYNWEIHFRNGFNLEKGGSHLKATPPSWTKMICCKPSNSVGLGPVDPSTDL